MYKLQQKSEYNKKGKRRKINPRQVNFTLSLSRYSAHGSRHLSPKIQRIQLIVDALQTTSYDELSTEFLSTRRKGFWNILENICKRFM